MRTILTSLLLAALSLVPLACNTAPKSAPPAGAGEYYEHRHQGRIYVLGSKASYEQLKQGQDLLYKIALTGAGPAGETVVIEADKEGTATEDRLRAEYAARHPQR